MNTLVTNFLFYMLNIYRFFVKLYYLILFKCNYDKTTIINLDYIKLIKYTKYTPNNCNIYYKRTSLNKNDAIPDKFET